MGHSGSRRGLWPPDCITTTRATCSRPSKSQTRVKSHNPCQENSHVAGLTVPSCPTKTTNVKARTNTLSHCVGYAQAQARGPNALKTHLLRTPGITICTPLLSAKISLKHFCARQCHNQSSGNDAVLRFGTDQTNSDATIHLSEAPEAQLTHTDAQGQAAMVDVARKVPTQRTATASATVVLGPTAFRLLLDNNLAKGDALAVAQLAGIMASKQTSALIPLCHTLSLDHVSVTFELDELQNAAVITATCRTTSRTGVEMEALTAVSVAALTVYDMCKAVSHDIIIKEVKLLSKTGGKRDFHR